MVTVICNGTVFTGMNAVFLDKDGTLANVDRYLTRLGYRQAQLMDKEMPGTHDVILRALGISCRGLDPAGLMAIGSRQETIFGIANAVLTIQDCAWQHAVDLAKLTLAEAARQCLPKARYTPLLPGALNFLQRSRRAGLKISMVSADAQPNLVSFIEQYQLQVYFDHLQGVSQHYPDKVDPGFLKAACHALKVEPNEVLVIGDAATDVKVARQCGGFIGFLGGWQPPLSAEAIAPQTLWESLPIPVAFASEFSQIQLIV